MKKKHAYIYKVVFPLELLASQIFSRRELKSEIKHERREWNDSANGHIRNQIMCCFCTSLSYFWVYILDSRKSSDVNCLVGRITLGLDAGDVKNYQKKDQKKVLFWEVWFSADEKKLLQLKQTACFGGILDLDWEKQQGYPRIFDV